MTDKPKQIENKITRRYLQSPHPDSIFAEFTKEQYTKQLRKHNLGFILQGNTNAST